MKAQLSKEARRIIRGYRWLVAAMIAVMGVFVGVLIYLIWGLNIDITLWSYVLVALFYIVWACVFVILANRYFQNHINSLINRDGNAALYREVIEGGRLYNNSYTGLISAYYFSGEYGDLVSIAATQLQKKKHRNASYVYFFELARVYFSVGDVEKLEAVCDGFDRYVASRGKWMRKQLEKAGAIRIMRYYRSFIGGDFEACYAYLDEKDQKATSDYIRHGNAFLRAIVLYRDGRLEEARELFLSSRDHLIGVHLAVLAQKWIERIDQGLPLGMIEEYLPQEWQKTEPRFVVSKVIRIVITVVAVLLIMTSIGFRIRTNREEAEYLTFLEDTVGENEAYGDVDALTWIFWENDDGTSDELIAVYETEKKGLLVGSIYINDDDESTCCFDPMVEGMEYDKQYHGLGICSNRIFTFALCKNETEIPKDAYAYFEFRYNGKQTYFYMIASPNSYENR